MGCLRSLPRAARSCCTPGFPLFPPVPSSGPGCRVLLPTPSPCYPLPFPSTVSALGHGTVTATLRCFSPHFLVPVKGPGAAAPRFSLPLPFLSPHLSLHWQTCCCTLGQGFAGGPCGTGEQHSNGQGRIMGTLLSWVLLLSPSLPSCTNCWALLHFFSPARCPRPSPHCCSCVSPSPDPAAGAYLAAYWFVCRG